MFYGKLIGGIIGLLTLGWFGAVLGVIVGHLFDRGLLGAMRAASPENLARTNRSFFETTFLLSGFLAKSDGHISQREIDCTEAIFARMGLDAEHRREAISLFKRGAAGDFQPEAAIAQFLQTCGQFPQLRQTLLFFLISLALADQRIDSAEQAALQRIAGLLGYAPAQLEHLLRMAQAQTRFQSGGAGDAQAPTTSLDDAYAALGVTEGVDDATLKRAWRKLMSENHPDKLIAKGVPEDMVKLATERSQEIQAAYELIKKSRGGPGKA